MKNKKPTTAVDEELDRSRQMRMRRNAKEGEKLREEIAKAEKQNVEDRYRGKH